MTSNDVAKRLHGYGMLARDIRKRIKLLNYMDATLGREISDYSITPEELEASIIADMDKLLSLKKELFELVKAARIQDRILLIYHYIYLMTNNEISNALNVSVRTLQKKYVLGIEAIAEANN